MSVNHDRRRNNRMTILGPLVAGVLVALAPQTAWTGATGRCGGTGGATTKTLTCPNGQYVVGLQARGGSYVDLVGIACAPIGPDGRRGTVGAFMSAGPGGGDSQNSKLCSGNRAVRSIFGYSGVWYDRLGGAFCDVRDTSSGRFKDFGDTIYISVGGTMGGKDCRLTCPSGEALYSLTVKSGSWVDSISGQCRP